MWKNNLGCMQALHAWIILMLDLLSLTLKNQQVKQQVRKIVHTAIWAPLTHSDCFTLSEGGRGVVGFIFFR